MPSAAPSLCLASSSPRRQAILAGLGLDFSTVSPSIDERREPGEEPEIHVSRLADAKSAAGQALVEAGDVLVLGSDTVVVARGEVLGKPRDADDARRILKMLSGAWHEVHTAVTIRAGTDCERVLVTSRVRMVPLTEEDIEAYWQSGEPRDKAGAYAIQGLGAMFVEKLEGSYSAVMGLPVCETVRLLSKWGLGPRRILGKRTS